MKLRKQGRDQGKELTRSNLARTLLLGVATAFIMLLISLSFRLSVTFSRTKSWEGASNWLRLVHLLGHTLCQGVGTGNICLLGLP